MRWCLHRGSVTPCRLGPNHLDRLLAGLEENDDSCRPHRGQGRAGTEDGRTEMVSSAVCCQQIRQRAGWAGPDRERVRCTAEGLTASLQA